MKMKRKDFFKICGAGLGSLMLSRKGWPQFPSQPKQVKFDFFFAQIVYGKGLGWNPRPGVARSLAGIINSRTSVPASPERVEVKLNTNDAFGYPFLYLSGENEFEPFSDDEIQRLRRWFDAGGLLLADDALGELDSGFDRSFRRELERIFPGEKLRPLPPDHTVFQTYYLLDRAPGRKASVPNLWGIDRGDLTTLIYSQNDLAGAIEQNSGQGFRYPVTPGGENQRETAIRLWVNLVYYGLCGNYKKDAVHSPFISERRKRRPK